MKSWKLISGVALVLVVGILVGSAGTWLCLKHKRPPHDPKARASFVLNKLSTKLSLTESQKIAVGKILEETHQRLHEHFLKDRPVVDGIINDSFSRIGKELNNEQKEKLVKVREKFERHRRRPQ